MRYEKIANEEVELSSRYTHKPPRCERPCERGCEEAISFTAISPINLIWLYDDAANETTAELIKSTNQSIIATESTDGGILHLDWRTARWTWVYLYRRKDELWGKRFHVLLL